MRNFIISCMFDYNKRNETKKKHYENMNLVLELHSGTNDKKSIDVRVDAL